MKLSRSVALALAGTIAIVIALLAWQSLARLEPAPAVTYTLLDGRKLTSDDLRGKVVLVNFWATSCVTCVKEMPQIAATHEKFRARGYETIAVAMSYDPPAFVSRFAETRQLPFAVAIDNTGEIAQRFGDVRLTPTTFLINQRGEIVKRYVGEPDFAALHALVDKLLTRG
ncbi:TlpA disulfide reductase family protein [Azohydromonas sediminis]|uniref:TlpA disulfide reductase family protein n=1 Tax=Azohydromonas sediminis TaxID=2259674 RepID=UPI000E6536C0|nr:TlpA disulfide reductase family protein [Azohydromonas sediminis]